MSTGVSLLRTAQSLLTGRTIHDSDHFPILIKCNTSNVEDHNPKWKLNKANWDLFQSLCSD